MVGTESSSFFYWNKGITTCIGIDKREDGSHIPGEETVLLEFDAGNYYESGNLRIQDVSFFMGRRYYLYS